MRKLVLLLMVVLSGAWVSVQQSPPAARESQAKPVREFLELAWQFAQDHPKASKDDILAHLKKVLPPQPGENPVSYGHRRVDAYKLVECLTIRRTRGYYSALPALDLTTDPADHSPESDRAVIWELDFHDAKEPNKLLPPPDESDLTHEKWRFVNVQGKADWQIDWISRNPTHKIGN